MNQSYGDLLARATRQLSESRIDNPRLDAQVLLMHLLHVDRAHLFLRLQDNADGDVNARLFELIERRAAGEPVAYLTGHREFMGLDFVVDSRVLIPRPETEGLVERALHWLEHHPGARRIVDVGVGSGTIAISVDRHTVTQRNMQVVGSDVSADALAVATRNRKRLGASRVVLVRGSLLEWCHGPVDLIVANLPYLREEQRNAGIAQEPELALYADQAGFALYARLIPQASEILVPDGCLICEIDPDQCGVAIETAQRAFLDADVRVEADLAERERYLIVERRSTVAGAR